MVDSPVELEDTLINSPDTSTSNGTESGWAAVAKSIREVDEQKIKDYKEDIDTILVFAGLYSAVLSALLAESYQALQPDPNAIMIALLSQVVLQTHSYIITSGYLNSTAAPFDANAVQTFSPGIAAKRVNVLWFASLTLSLISASFGILVKQWLREYLAGEYISPQARLRIRHFRTPALSDWHVFAIAALLPLVLQLALALFFVGLCFFTLDIHSSVGYTTIPLVAAWALLFMAATFAPALSPRCPYKIPIFKPMMRHLRANLVRFVRVLGGLGGPQGLASKGWAPDYNEEDAAKDARSDLDILVDVDAIQTDDQLLTEICTALKEMHATPEVTIDFVLKLIRVRLQRDFEEGPLPSMLDLSRLPVRTSTILVDTVADVLVHEVRRFPISEPIQWTSVTRDCLSLLAARLPCTLSGRVTEVVALCFAGTQSSRAQGTCDALFAATTDRHILYRHLQERFRTAFIRLNAYQSQVAMWQLLKHAFCICKHPRKPCMSVSAVLGRHVDTIPVSLRQCTYEYLTDYMLHQLKVGSSWTRSHAGIMVILFEERARTERTVEPWHSALSEFVRQLLTKPKLVPHFYPHLFHVNDYNLIVESIFRDAFTSSTEKQEILGDLCSVLSGYVTEMTKMPVLLNDEFYLKLLLFVDGQFPLMRHVVTMSSRAVTRVHYLPLYQRLWNTVHVALRHIRPCVITERHTRWARTCLRKIDSLDDLWLPPRHIHADSSEDFANWAQVFESSHSFFDDAIIEALMKFLPYLENSESKRVRCVLLKREQDQLSQAKAKGRKEPVRTVEGTRETNGDVTQVAGDIGSEVCSQKVELLRQETDDTLVSQADDAPALRKCGSSQGRLGSSEYISG